ncbi:MAG: hypothetical protein O3A19_07010 [Planctomycetota bacterium]|jgi:hypothetical protein|nr:hypothetical protein [Planctomycetota bacterium]MDA1026163.1 hypothetical protein [Planctomycetota bacterium]
MLVPELVSVEGPIGAAVVAGGSEVGGAFGTGVVDPPEQPAITTVKSPVERMWARTTDRGPPPLVERR